jgi:hypothetical protein
MSTPDSTLPPSLARCIRDHIDDDDELPPCLGEKVRTVTYDIHRTALEAEQEEKQS